VALNPKVTAARRNAMLDNFTGNFNNGYLRLYDSVQPSDADQALGAQVLLAELRFGATAFAAASGGSASANAITDDASANATGTCTWFRCLASDGTTVLCDGSVGTSGSNLNLNSVAIQSGATVSVSSFTITMAAG
jgi:hypothetical protein